LELELSDAHRSYPHLAQIEEEIEPEELTMADVPHRAEACQNRVTYQDYIDGENTNFTTPSQRESSCLKPSTCQGSSLKKSSLRDQIDNILETRPSEADKPRPGTGEER